MKNTMLCPIFSFCFRYLLFLGAACFLIANQVCAAEPVTLQLRWFHQFQFAGYYAAIQQGYYAEEGLDVRLIERDLNTSPVVDVLEGRADYGVSDSEILLSRLRGNSLVALAAILQHSPLVLIARAEQKVTSPHNLIGKTVLMSTRSSDVGLLAMLRNESVSLDSLTVVDRFARTGDYFSEKFSAVAAYLTNQPFLYASEGIAYTVLRPSSYGIDMYGDCLFTSQERVRSKPEEVASFRRASLRGWTYAMQHPVEMVEYILKEYGSKKSREHLLYEAAVMRELMFPDLVEIGHMNIGRWKHIAKTFADVGVVRPEDVTSVEWSDFIYDPNPEVDTTKLYWALLIACGLLVAVSAIFIGLAVFAKRLHREVDERSAAELRERESRRYVQGIINAMPSVIIGVDTSGEISHWNTLAEQYLKDDSLLQKGAKFYEIFPHLQGRIPDPLGVMQEGEPQFVSRLLSQGDQEPRYEDIAVFPLMQAALATRSTYPEVTLATGAVIRIDDVTERTRMEEMLIQSEKMLSVGGLAAGMAHEINNPLGTILQGVQNINRRLSDSLEANNMVAEELGCPLVNIRAYLEKRKIFTMLTGMQEAGERAARIVSNMLTFSRKSSGEIVEVNLVDLVEQTLELAGTDYSRKREYDFRHIHITRKFSTDVPLVLCDKGKIQQVLLNLLRNGAEAMFGKTYEEGNQPTFTITLEKAQGMARVSIQDNGPGMPEHVRSRVFEPFFTTKPVGVGTGLGLSIAFFIIQEEHQGRLYVESSVGEWTRFVIQLPAL